MVLFIILMEIAQGGHEVGMAEVGLFFAPDRGAPLDMRDGVGRAVGIRVVSLHHRLAVCELHDAIDLAVARRVEA